MRLQDGWKVLSWHFNLMPFLNTRLMAALRAALVFLLRRACPFLLRRDRRNPPIYIYKNFTKSLLPLCVRNARNLLTALIYEKCGKFCIYHHPKWIKGVLTTKNIYIITCFNNAYIIRAFLLKIIPKLLSNLCIYCARKYHLYPPPPLPDFAI